MVSLSSLFGDEAQILHETDFRVLLLVAVLPVLGFALMSPILDSLVGPFGATSANIGLMISVITAPGIVLIPLAGVLADKFGRKPVLIASIFLFGLGGTAIIFTTDFKIVLALRFVQGVGLAGLNPIIITSIGDMYSMDVEATGQGIRFMISGLSGAIFPLIAGGLILFAWQYPFLLYAISFPVAVVVYFWFDEPTGSAGFVVTNGGDSASYTRALLQLASHRRVLSMVLARSLMPTVWFGFVTYISFIVVQLLDGTPLEAGILTTIGFLIFAVSASQAGRVTALLESRLYLLVGGNLCLGIGFVIVLFAPNMIFAIVGIIISAIGFGFLGSLYRTIITNLAPESLRAGIVSLSEAGGRLTATLTPLIMGGIIASTSPTMGFASSLRLAGVTMAIVGTGGGIIALIAASASPSVPID